MKTINPSWLKSPKRSSLILAASFALAAASTGHAQTLLLDLKASNYNNATGVWTDSSTNNDTATGPTGLLLANSTPNGSSAVHLDGSHAFSLATSIPVNTGTNAYTLFVFVAPTAANYGALISGGGGSLEYRINSDLTQGTVRTSQNYLGSSSTPLTLNTYASINVTVSSTGGTYRLNGSASGTTSGDGSIAQPLTNIGSQFTAPNPGFTAGSEAFTGNIAEIQVYSGALTDAQRAAVESQFNASYVTAAATPEPGTWAMGLVGIGALLCVQRFRTRKA